MPRARAGKDMLSRLADAGEEAIKRLPDMAGADKVSGVANAMRDRMDDMQKKLRGLEALEKRVAALERKVAAQGKPAAAKPKRPVPRKSPPSSSTKRPS